MLNEDGLRLKLEAAAKAGLVDAAQIPALADFLIQRDAADTPVGVGAVIPGEEDLRFVRNFHDVFLATGIVLLSVGLAVTTAVVTEHAAGGRFIVALTALSGSALATWALAEVFSRRRRLFLPSIALCLSFAVFCIFAALTAYSMVVGRWVDIFDNGFSAAAQLARGAAPVAVGAGLIASAVFYARFRLPFAMGLTGLNAVLLVIAAVFWLSPDVLRGISSALILLGGLGMFFAGVWFDARDPSRATRISDNGFWLHLGAAPLILNGVLTLVGGGVVGIIGRDEAHSNTTAAFVTLAVVAVLGLASLLINRRALIVSALLSTGFAVGALMKAVGMEAGASPPRPWCVWAAAF